MGTKNTLIRNNLRGGGTLADLDEQIKDDRLKAPERNALIHDGLIFALKRIDPDYQEWINTTDEYPERLFYSRQKEMDALFVLVHSRICDVMFSKEHAADIEDENSWADDYAEYRTCLKYRTQL